MKTSYTGVALVLPLHNNRDTCDCHCRDRIARMPSLASFKPTFWCLGRWSQTVVGGASSPPDPLPYRREVVRMPDGVEVSHAIAHKTLHVFVL